MPKGGDFIPRVKEIEDIIEKDDKERLINNASCDQNRLREYKQAVHEAKLLVFGRGKIHYDSPETPYSYHALTLFFKGDEFDEKEINVFADIIKPFSSMELLGSHDGNLTVLLIMDGIYKEN